MKRRKFIKDSLGGLPLLMLTPSLLASCAKEDEIKPNGKTVIVVGAGISGLAAAKRLQQQGFTVIVVEAKEKIGGRLRTDRTLGIPFDEGASWIHGPNRNPIRNLASQAGASTFLTDDEQVKVFDTNGTAYSDASLTNAESQFMTALREVQRTSAAGQSFESVFNALYPTQSSNRLWKYMLSAYLEFDTGSDISQLSAKYFDDDEAFGGDDVIITNGYDKITDYLGQGLEIRLNSAVSAIDYAQDKVKVTVNGEVLECEYVLVSVPLGVLKNDSIAFMPALPAAKSSAIHQLSMGNINKFLLVWESAFWDTGLQYIGFTPETKGKFNYFLNLRKFTSHNALMTFAFGNYATQTESLTDGEIIDEIMQHLKGIYGNNIPNPSHLQRTKWGQDENTFGAYSFVSSTASSEDFDILANSVLNKVFFAGEHTERDYRGTTHGAYLSGIREANKIIDLQ